MQEPKKRPVWDLPTRIFHWCLASSLFLSAFIVYGKKYLALHIVFGAIASVLVTGRLVWGFVGTRYVLFGAFMKSPSEAKKEFAMFGEEKHSHIVGHPVVAGWVMLFLMFCALCVGVSGWWLYLFSDETSKESLLNIHEIFANTLLILAFVHVQGVILHILSHNDGIVRGMIDGKRPAYPNEQIPSLSTKQKLFAYLWFIVSIFTAVYACRLAYN